jgi:H+/Cl- antiporter ClcA/CBS domain-containing protein
VAAIAGARVVALLARWAPVIKGHGIPEAMEAILTKESRIQPRAAIAKPLSAAVAIGTGGPFGAEGPIIVTGGALGSLLGQVVEVSPAERKILLACGAAAGMSATFGTPLAAVILAIELLIFEFSPRAFVPLVVSSAVAAGMHAALFGTGPLFTVSHHDYAGLEKLPAFVVLGLVCGLLATVLTRGLFLVEAGFRRLPVGEFWHPVVGAAGFCLVGLLVPRALGVGYDAISDVLLGRLAVGTLAVLGAAKLLAWWVALGSGTSGGTLAPILLISASAGSLLGTAAQHVVPSAHVAPGAFALVAMAATFGAATWATFASIVFVFELTRDYSVILPLMLATVVADVLARALLGDSIMTEKLTRRGVTVHSAYAMDVLRTTSVRKVMTTDVVALPASVTAPEARVTAERAGHGAYPLVDGDGRCVGMVTSGDLAALDGSGAAVSAAAGSSGPPVTVAPDDPVLRALERMLESGADHLPVVDGEGVLVGICTRGDVLRARKEAFASERPQAGWRPDLAKWRRKRT